MKKIFLAFMLVLLMTSVCLAAQQDSPLGIKKGETVKSYDKYGSYQGKYKSDGQKVKSYDKYGRYEGSYKQSSNQVKQYDKYGRYQGSYKK